MTLPFTLDLMGQLWLTGPHGGLDSQQDCWEIAATMDQVSMNRALANPACRAQARQLLQHSLFGEGVLQACCLKPLGCVAFSVL